ncbi:MAG: chloride channel protein [Burkholderiaceae bacterium]|nr:chloride channel protein [Burkholderiaceae bacterium]
MPSHEPDTPPQKSRRIRLMDSSRDVGMHVLIWLVAASLIGLAAVALALSSDYANMGNLWLQKHLQWGMLILVPLAFALFAWLTQRFFPGTQGSGIPQTIAAINDPDDAKKSNLLSIRILIGKSIMLLGGLFVGASIGREGPTVQIGASIGHFFYQRGPFKTADYRRTLVMAGGAAGIAAAFNTPLAGIMFAMEELSKDHPFTAHSSTLLTVIVSGLISLSIVGNYTYFGATSAILPLFSHIPAISACAVVGGVMGGLFSLLAQKFGAFLPARIRGFVQQHPFVFAGVCGLVVAIAGLMTDGLAFGTSYAPTRHILESQASTAVWYYGFAKFLATLASTISGIPGGLFAPTLSVGAGIGDTLSALLPGMAPHGATVILVMVAYLSGVTRSPLTSFIITMEMVAGQHFLLALMATSLLASCVSRFISPVPLYHALAERYRYPQVTHKT